MSGADPQPTPDDAGALRVLLVEDNPDDAFVVDDMLLDTPGVAPLLHARKLKDALELVRRSELDLVLLDLTLPDAEGLDTFRRLREGLPQVPVVILSGREDEQLALDAVRAGAEDYLRKGELTSVSLQRAVRYAASRSRRRAEPRRVDESHDRFRTLLEGSAQATLVCDRERRVLYVNPAAAAAIGCSADDLLRRQLPEVRAGGAALLELGPVRGLARLRLTDTVWEGALALLAIVESFQRDGAVSAGLRAPATTSRFEGLRTASPAMAELFERCDRVAATEASVLLLGETGTGKELVARAIHRRSGRGGYFVALDCGAVPAALVESELFGHEKGAFTGAAEAKVGLFRQAHGGTLLLDEVGNLAAPAQFSLLRALQERGVRPVGGTREHPVDVRLIAATSVPLFDAVEEGRFREDLLYRLDVIRLEIPPLRERPEDVLHLFRFFLGELAERYEVESPEVGGGFLEAMLDFAWPGNVRQLENFTERLVLLGLRSCLTRRHFHDLVRPYRPRRSDEPSAAVDDGVDTALDLASFLEQQERRYLAAALRETGGQVTETARRAGVNRKTLFRKLKKYDMAKEDFR